jgi:hypothetical protein
MSGTTGWIGRRTNAAISLTAAPVGSGDTLTCRSGLLHLSLFVYDIITIYHFSYSCATLLPVCVSMVVLSRRRVGRERPCERGGFRM